MNRIKMTVFPGELGWMAAAWKVRRLHHLTFGHSSPRSAARRLSRIDTDPEDPDTFMRSLIKRLQDFARGDHRDRFLDVDLETSDMTRFQRAVIHHCRRVVAGETITYGELAARSGYPGAARAVGRVMATNRFPLLVPCHRVVAASGRLCGFSAPKGIAMKRRLLAD